MPSSSSSSSQPCGLDDWELGSLCRHVRKSNYSWARRVFAVPTALTCYAEGLLPIGKPWDDPCEGVVGSSSSRPLPIENLYLYELQVDCEYPGRPGWSRIIANYQPIRWGGFPSPAEPIVGRLMVDIMGQLYKPYLDENGQVIEGWAKDLANQKLGEKWKVVKGIHSKLKPYCTLKIEGVALLGSFNVNTYWDLVGHINSDANSLGGADKGKLRFDGVRAYGSIENDALLDVQFFFAYHQDGWNNQLFSQKYSPGVKEVEAGETGTLLKTQTEVFATYDADGTNEVATSSTVRILYPEDSFAFFKSYLYTD
jgi:hypothetical protein